MRKAIAADPETRYRTPQEFIQALDGLQIVDWKHDNAGLLGTWTGGWPPKARPARRDTYRVTGRGLEAGPHRGRLRLVADYRKAGSLGWRRIGLDDVTCEPNDADRVRKLFRDVEAKAAQRRPAR